MDSISRRIFFSILKDGKSVSHGISFMDYLTDYLTDYFTDYFTDYLTNYLTDYFTYGFFAYIRKSRIFCMIGSAMSRFVIERSDCRWPRLCSFHWLCFIW